MVEGAKKERRGLKSVVQNHVIVLLAGTAIASWMTAWTVAHQVWIKPRDLIIGETRLQLSQLKNSPSGSAGVDIANAILVQGVIQFDDNAGRADLVRFALEPPPRTYEVRSNGEFELRLLPDHSLLGELKLPQVNISHQGYKPEVLSLDYPADHSIVKLPNTITLQRQ